MNLQIACTRCNGQVIERRELEGVEERCLNCGFNQVPVIIPDEALARDSEDYQLRNRGGFSIPPYRNIGGEIERTDRTLYNKIKRERNQKAKKLDKSFYGEHCE